MKKVFLRLLSIVLAASIALCSAVTAFAVDGELYIADLRIIYADDYEEAKEILEDSEFSDYKLLRENLNEDSGEIGVWLAYKTTTNIDDAITDLAVMQMNGGYTEGNYREMLRQSYEEYIEMGEIYVEAIEYLAEAYAEGHFLAESAYRQLNFYVGLDDHEDERIGDIFLDGIDAAELATMFLEANSYVLRNIRSLISMGVSYNEDGKTYLDKVGDEAAEFISDASRYDNEDYDDLAALVAPTITVFKNMFKELAAYEDEMNYTDDDVTALELKYIEYKAIADMMRAVEYLDGKTLYQFCLDYTVDEDDYSALYPLVAALNEGQIAMTKVAHYYDVVRYSMDIYPRATVEEKIAEYEEKYGENPFDIYTGVDRSVFEGSFALTSAASRADAYTETSLAEAFFGEENLAKTFTYISTGVVGAALLIGGIYSAADDLASSAGSTVTEQTVTSVADTVVQSVEDQVASAVNALATKPLEFASYEGMFMEDALNVMFFKYANPDTALIDSWSNMTFAAKYEYFSDVLDAPGTMFQTSAEMSDKVAFNLIRGETVAVKGAAVDSAQPVAEEATKTAVESTSSGITFFSGFILVAGGIMMLYSALNLAMTVYNYYHPDYDDIPIAMVDLIETVDGDRYIKYDAVLEAETNADGEYSAGDLNAFAGQRWNALYYTKSYEAGKPLLADEFVVSNSSNRPKDGYTPVHRFGEEVCYDINKYNFDGDTHIYLSVKQSKNDKSAVAEVPELVGSMLGAGYIFLAGGIGALLGIGGTMLTQSMLKKKKIGESAEA